MIPACDYPFNNFHLFYLYFRHDYDSELVFHLTCNTLICSTVKTHSTALTKRNSQLALYYFTD